MKSLTIIFFLIFSIPLMSQDFGTMKQPYLSCTPTPENLPENMNFELRLENAAVGDATGITLFYYENYNWNQVYKADILKTVVVDETTYYAGQIFLIARTLKDLGPHIEPIVAIDAVVVVDSKALRLKMHCTTVE